MTGASLDYEGRLTIDQDLMEKVGLLPFERVLCSNTANGARFETYAIPRIRGSILDELRSQDWFPRSLRRKAKQIEEQRAAEDEKIIMKPSA